MQMTSPLQGQYDRVHVGASCPSDRLSALLSLLRPSGGKIVAPVSPNDMRVISVDDKGAITQKVISQVRYSELEVRAVSMTEFAANRKATNPNVQRCASCMKQPASWLSFYVCIDFWGASM